MSTTQTRPLADRLGTALATCPDVATVAHVLFRTMDREVPFAFACLATADPVSGLITRAYKSHPLPVSDQEFAATEYGEPDINQLVDIAQRPLPVGVLSVDTGGHPERCRRFREYMVPWFGFTDELRLGCIANGTTWGFVGLYRGPGEPSFTERDGRVLVAAHEVVADAIRRTLFADTPPGPDPAYLPVVVVVDADDRVTDVSAGAETVVDELGGWENGALPTAMLAVTATARSSGVVSDARVRARSGRWLGVRAMPLQSTDAGRAVVLTVDTAPAAVVGRMAIAARGLTAREQDVVGLVLQGASTAAIAGALHLSPHTVQDHLKSVFTKLDVTSRRELIATFVIA